ncbi:helix-turn-helix domain-containing protein [Kribbella solani]|uniref:helix-turn-helix domain-containing protein n=1 Tax=Kribbella solani TaxID=236067 RepID=UPI0029A6CB57|nr:helix-turn-helix domain-containing protein [Kribbella solani]MDX2972350.1 DUF2690 domain-containing protein [Kribbella solani]
MSGTGGADDELARFSAELQELLRDSRFTSFRELARHLHYSHELVARTARGKEIPSLEATLAFVRACGGDPEEWEAKWRALPRNQKSVSRPTIASPAWPARAVADGADPEDARCHADAVTIHAQKVSLTSKRHIIGQIELRYSPSSHAAWGRFKGTEGLDKLAAFRHKVDLNIGVEREGVSAARLSYAVEYAFDNHWSDILLTGEGVFFGWVEIFFDGDLVASGKTRKATLR